MAAFEATQSEITGEVQWDKQGERLSSKVSEGSTAFDDAGIGGDSRRTSKDELESRRSSKDELSEDASSKESSILPEVQQDVQSSLTGALAQSSLETKLLHILYMNLLPKNPSFAVVKDDQVHQKDGSISQTCGADDEVDSAATSECTAENDGESAETSECVAENEGESADTSDDGKEKEHLKLQTEVFVDGEDGSTWILSDRKVPDETDEQNDATGSTSSVRSVEYAVDQDDGSVWVVGKFPKLEAEDDEWEVEVQPLNHEETEVIDQDDGSAWRIGENREVVDGKLQVNAPAFFKQIGVTGPELAVIFKLVGDEGKAKMLDALEQDLAGGSNRFGAFEAQMKMSLKDALVEEDLFDSEMQQQLGFELSVASAESRLVDAGAFYAKLGVDETELLLIFHMLGEGARAQLLEALQRDLGCDSCDFVEFTTLIQKMLADKLVKEDMFDEEMQKSLASDQGLTSVEGEHMER